MGHVAFCRTCRSTTLFDFRELQCNMAMGQTSSRNDDRMLPTHNRLARPQFFKKKPIPVSQVLTPPPWGSLLVLVVLSLAVLLALGHYRGHAYLNAVAAPPRQHAPKPKQKDGLAAADTQQGVLVVYLYDRADLSHARNLQFFVEQGMGGGGEKDVEYLVIVQQVTDAYLSQCLHAWGSCMRSTLPHPPESARCHHRTCDLLWHAVQILDSTLCTAG